MEKLKEEEKKIVITIDLMIEIHWIQGKKQKEYKNNEMTN